MAHYNKTRHCLVLLCEKNLAIAIRDFLLSFKTCSQLFGHGQLVHKLFNLKCSIHEVVVYAIFFRLKKNSDFYQMNHSCNYYPLFMGFNLKLRLNAA